MGWKGRKRRKSKEREDVEGGREEQEKEMESGGGEEEKRGSERNPHDSFWLVIPWEQGPGTLRAGVWRKPG